MSNSRSKWIFSLIALIVLIPKFSFAESEGLDFNKTINLPKVPFKQYYYDVDSKYWASESITRLTELGVVRGVGNGNFYPEKDISLREFLTVLGRYIETQNSSIISPIRYDQNYLIDKEQWGYLEVSNVINRIPREKLVFIDFSDLNRSITKEEAVYLIENIVKFNRDLKRNTDLIDIDNSLFEKEIKILYNAGAVSGYPSDMFYPKQNISRAELITILNNILR